MSPPHDKGALAMLPLLAPEEQSSRSSNAAGYKDKNQGIIFRERRIQQEEQEEEQEERTEATTTFFDSEDGSSTVEGLSSRDRHHRQVARPTKRLLLAKPTPSEPITDPFAFVCDIARRPKFGHQYILFPSRSRRHRGEPIGLSVGPHWAGVLYTISMIAVVTLFLTRVVLSDIAPWCQPASVVCALITTAFLLATAVTDPGIVVQGAEGGEGEGSEYCEECSIWRPDGAEHCDEW